MFGMIGNIHPYYRDMVVTIYKRFGTSGFTCNDIKGIKGFKNFQCQQLRSWHNEKIVKNIQKKLEGERKPVRVWRFTSQALYALKSYFPD